MIKKPKYEVHHWVWINSSTSFVGGEYERQYKFFDEESDAINYAKKINESEETDTIRVYKRIWSSDLNE